MFPVILRPVVSNVACLGIAITEKELYYAGCGGSWVGHTQESHLAACTPVLASS